MTHTLFVEHRRASSSENIRERYFQADLNRKGDRQVAGKHRNRGLSGGGV